MKIKHPQFWLGAVCGAVSFLVVQSGVYGWIVSPIREYRAAFALERTTSAEALRIEAEAKIVRRAIAANRIATDQFEVETPFGAGIHWTPLAPANVSHELDRWLIEQHAEFTNRQVGARAK